MSPRNGFSRRELLRTSVAAGVGMALSPLSDVSDLFAQAASANGQDEEMLSARRAADRFDDLITRPIPSTGERLPVIGVGTARRYEVGTTTEERAPLKEVLKRLPELGGKVIDTAPAYGPAETVVGDLVAELGNRDKLFLATKVSSRTGDRAAIEAQMTTSLQRLKTTRIDLMQIWNMAAVAQTLPVLREWKAAGKIRYLGITTSMDAQYDALVSVMEKEPLDFVQVDYAVDAREVEARILPMAKDKGIAVLTALPFGRSRVFTEVAGKAVPEWAKEIDCTTWAQLFLKFIVSHPAITCAIPGTAKLTYLEDNQRAARGRLPDEAMRKRIIAEVGKS